MTTPEPIKPDPTSILTALTEAFRELPPLLSFGGLVLIVAVVGVWLVGDFSDLLLAIPAIAIAAFLIFAYLNNRFELEKARLEAEKVREKQQFENQLALLAQQQKGDLEMAQLDLEREKLKATLPVTSLIEAKQIELPADAAWPESYLSHVWHNCFHLHMTSIDPKAQELGTSVLNLHSVFTSLDVPVSLEIREMSRQQAALAFGDPESRTREPALAFIGRSENKQLVLLGQPGSGKSTLVKYLALCLSGARLEKEETNLESLIERGWRLTALMPVLVILRDYAAKGLPQKQSLWAFVADGLKEAGFGGNVQPLSDHLKQEGGILLLDGLDEVPEAHQRRDQLRQAIINFTSRFPKVRVVVTSRPYAYQDPAWQLPDFSQTTLLDFTSEQIEHYIDRWYGVAGPQDASLGKERAQQYAEDLKAQVKRNPNLQELAPRPLLLALMVSLHRWRGGGLLPERREQLYDASVNLLLDLWQRPKLILDEQGRPRGKETSALTELGIDAVALRKALSRLAFEVHAEQPEEASGTADIEHEKLVTILRQAVPKEKRDATPYEKIAEYVRDRAGLLEDRGEGIYGFPHRTFQEYLAAMHLLDREDFPTNIVDLVREDPVRWREVTLLAGNSAQTTLQWSLVEILYQRQKPPQTEQEVEEAQWWGVYLAGQVLHDSELLTKETKLYLESLKQVKEWHTTILERGALPPRDRAKAGIILAELGDGRPGVGVVEKSGILIPDIEWGEEVPAGRYEIGGDKESYNSFKKQKGVVERPYRLARYPITLAQFQCFVEAKDFSDSQWWAGMPEMVEDWRGEKYPLQEIAEQAFPFDNHPREMVSWYQAVAFCRWLGDKLGYGVDLPHEYEWEAAARYPDGRFYPWGNNFDVERANINESGIGQSSAVGMYPSGRNSALDLYDLSGNVWEWCRNTYDQPDEGWPKLDNNPLDDKGNTRVLRGGSWGDDRYGARAAFRLDFRPNGRSGDVGFRVVVRRPPSQDH